MSMEQRFNRLVTWVYDYAAALAFTVIVGGLFVLAAVSIYISPPAPASPPPASRLHTVIYDGHWFIMNPGGGVLLHPDCPKCKQTQTSKE